MRYILFLLCIVMAASASAQVQYLGSPTTTVRNRGNFVSDSLFYLPKRQKAPSDTGAIRYAIADSSVYVWTGYQWNKLQPGAFVAISDTASMLNPYIRAAGYGLTKSGQSLIVDTAAIATRARVQKGIDSVANLSRVTGSGTTNYVAKFTGSTALGNSSIFDDGEVKINTTSDAGDYRLQVIGGIYNNTSAVFAAAGGSVGIGTASPLEKLHMVASDADILLDTYGDASLLHTRYANGTVGSPTIITNGQTAMQFLGQGWDGNGYRSLAGFLFAADDVTGADDMPGRIVFSTTPNGSTTLTERMRLDNAGNLGIGTTSPSYLLDVNGTMRSTGNTFLSTSGSNETLIGTTTDAGAYALQVTGNIYNTGSITTGAPSGGSIKPWKIGEAATVSPTPPNRTIRVEIDGTVYYLHAKTTND